MRYYVTSYSLTGVQTQCGCILPNCAFVVKPSCPTCGHVQDATVECSGTVADNQVTTTEGGGATPEGTTEDAAVQSPASKAYVESDIGHGLVRCELKGCGEVYRVFVNLTLTAQALGRVTALSL